MSRFTSEEPPGQDSDSQQSALYTEADEVEFKRAMRPPLSPAKRSAGFSIKSILFSLFLFSIGISLSFGYTYLKQNFDTVKLTTVRPSPAPVKTLPPATTDRRQGSQIQFGSIARTQCQDTCKLRQEIEQESCVRSCRRYSLENFARRVTAGNLNPSKDAELIYAGCIQGNLELAEAPSLLNWQQTMAKGIALLTSVSPSGEQLSNKTLLEWSNALLSLNRSVELPPERPTAESDMARLLVQTSCIKLHNVLAARGERNAVERDDAFSKRNYQRMKQILQEKVADHENFLIQRASKMGVTL